MSGVTDRIYIHEDVHLHPRQAGAYLESVGSHFPFRSDAASELVGTWAQLRPMGRWPRAVNLWELDWERLARMVEQQYGEGAHEPRFDEWWKRLASQRKGGWDRVLRPGPGSPDLDSLRAGPRLPCVLKHWVTVRPGAVEEYLSWVAETAAPAAEGAGWRLLMWFGAVHGAGEAIALFAAPDWSRLGDLARALPAPATDLGATVDASALQAWPGSRYLDRGA